MDYFEFEELIAAGVFELHSFPMPQIPGFRFSIRICENRHLALPDHISHYFSVQLCVKKGPRKSELKMRSELSDFQLEGTLNLTQNFGGWEPHCMRGVIFKPNVFEEQQEKITTELIEYGTYEYNPKTSRPAFNGWHFGTKKNKLHRLSQLPHSGGRQRLRQQHLVLGMGCLQGLLHDRNSAPAENRGYYRYHVQELHFGDYKLVAVYLFKL